MTDNPELMVQIARWLIGGGILGILVSLVLIVVALHALLPRRSRSVDDMYD